MPIQKPYGVKFPGLLIILHPLHKSITVKLNQNVYEKGVALSKTAIKAIEQRLQRNPELLKWDILIQRLSG